MFLKFELCLHLDLDLDLDSNKLDLDLDLDLDRGQRSGAPKQQLRERELLLSFGIRNAPAMAMAASGRTGAVK